MKLKDFDYDLPKNLIAQEPVSPRDQSRLLVLQRRRRATNAAHANENRNTGQIKHQYFYEIVNYLKPGDVLVLNNTKVMRARLIGQKADTGGRVEVFLLKKNSPNPLYQGGRKTGEVWQCLIGGKRRKEYLTVVFKQGLTAEIINNNQDGTWNVKFNKTGANFMKIVEKIGRVPLPPYIKRQENQKTKKQESRDYQTVYADESKLGSVAAPTAGFHFTKKLISQLKKKGVQFEYVTLQVGLGTFAPVKTDDITKHKIHSEWVEADQNTLRRILQAKLEGRRIIAVGTTSVRVLESVFLKIPMTNVQCPSKPHPPAGGPSPKIKHDKNLLRATSYALRDYSGWTDIFIYPGYKFKVVDVMITNFHLPKSTLLMLVSAFAGRDKIFKAYQAAVKKKYRFFSYGDAMLII